MTIQIRNVAVIGAGYMGGGIAQSLALAGVRVTLADASPDTTAAALRRLHDEAVAFERQGLFPSGAAGLIADNLRAAGSIAEAVADADFIEEAVPEIPALKRDVLAQISDAARADAIIATNTSTLPVHTLADAVRHPRRFLTVHFSNPAPFIPGVELVCGADTDPAIVPAIRDLLARAGRRCAQVADTPGFVLNRLQYVLLKEATLIVEEGVATPEDLDTLVSTTFGFRLPFFGPFAIADMAGLDVYANCFRTFEEAFGPRLATPASLTALVAEGRFGTKSGAGYSGSFDKTQTDALIAYRNKAYARMSQLLQELGPSPLQRKE
ncbi:3-hydroxyacyl-CoA dehydrogenase family protein [Gluconacetobacter azotocaptans]|uniref:L-gulonate 3-dehydrogenase n=1 Tax=Gluconacetobacter azotocaptans TaxID=142834 RepID=A0A7W4PFN0_9PROT|nr:3-hydroxyacyl-CoA dehydrogenase family protein [Gluconacetobacter azotocaptans]MBB2191865.1 3-hydroxyacyl-CoA dehydrogenase family protein [Gluconacetobacter azotocaptans]GBQ30661.1 3-hydroxyacyl-CoA dehydrogenase [Gluconacetobacter azotocaptans DSM 13594]